MISIKHNRIGDAYIFEIDGRLDSMSATKFQSTILHAADQADCQHIVLDMQGVDYLSAAGLRVLGELREMNGQVYIASPSQRVRDVLQITGLDITYSVHHSFTDALHTLQPMHNGYVRLELGWLTAFTPPLTGTPYYDWLAKFYADDAPQPDELHDQYAMTAIASGLREMVANGTTSIVDVSRDGRSIAPMARSQLRGTALIEVAGTRLEDVDHRFNSLRMKIEQYRPRTNQRLKIGVFLAGLHAVHPELIEKVVTYARAESLPIAISVAQTKSDVEFIETGEGALLTRFYNAERPAVPSPRKNIAAAMQDLGLLALKPLLIHATHMRDADIQLIAEAGCTVVHTPRSDIRLRNGRMPLESMLAANIPVSFGTGSRARVPDYDIMHEVETAIALHYGKVMPETIAELVTTPLSF